MTIEMFNLMGTLAIIVASLIGVTVLIRKFFEHLLEYQNKRETKAIENVNKVFDKIPGIMMKTVMEVDKYIDNKNKPAFKVVERKEDDIDVEDILPY